MTGVLGALRKESSSVTKTVWFEQCSYIDQARVRSWLSGGKNLHSEIRYSQRFLATDWVLTQGEKLVWINKCRTPPPICRKLIMYLKTHNHSLLYFLSTYTHPHYTVMAIYSHMHVCRLIYVCTDMKAAGDEEVEWKKEMAIERWGSRETRWDCGLFPE